MNLLTPELGLFVWTAIAFLIVFFILAKFAWKPILKSLGEREAGIADAIAAADKVRSEMSKMQAENEKLMAQAREERTKMLNEAKEIKDKMIKDAENDAKLKASKIIEEAAQQIQHQKMAALTEVKNEIGGLALELAEKILRKQLATADAQADFSNSLMDSANFN